MSETYPQIQVVDLDETATSFDNVYKDMTVSKFKRVVGIRKRAPQSSWECMRLFADGEEMENDRTLESYQLESGARLRFVASSADISARRTPLSPHTTASSTPTMASQASTAFSVRKTFPTIFVEDFDGRSLTLSDVPHNELAEGLRQRIAAKKGMTDAESIRIIYRGKELQNGRILTDYDVQNSCTLHIVLRLPGGQQE